MVFLYHIVIPFMSWCFTTAGLYVTMGTKQIESYALLVIHSIPSKAAVLAWMKLHWKE